MVNESHGRRVELGVSIVAQRQRASAPFVVCIFIAVVRGTLYAVPDEIENGRWHCGRGTC